MKAFLTTLALAPALAVAADALPPAQQELFETERAFVRAAAAKGFRDSFYEYFADDGIAFNPHPFRVRVALAGQPSTPPPMGADWAPVWGDIAAAGDLGWNTGPLLYPGRDGKPDRHGLFFSVWKRQADGKFKVVLDIGSDTPAAVAPITEPPHSSWRDGQVAAGGVDVAAASARLRDVEQAFLAESAAAGIGRAYASRLDDEARIHRPGVMPVTGRVALGEWAGAQSGRYRGEPLFADVSRSGELGYTWGSYERTGEMPDAGYFARVWKKDPRGEWRIVMDTVSPVPAGTKPLTAALMRAETPYLEGRWAEAEAAYRQFIEAHPENAFAWNRIGTSQVQQKKYAEAVTSLEHAIAIGGGGAVDFYNLACAYALAGDPDKALDSIERAIGAGLRRREQYETDPDLASLRELPRFRTLMGSLGG
jgi:tetratricopeptide (TPR) repeat protein